MILRNESEAANTRGQIDWEEKRIQTLQTQPGEPTRAREVTLQSLRRLLGQLKEDIARYESLHASKA